MIDLAAIDEAATPLERGFERIRQNGADNGNSIAFHVYHGDDPVAEDVPSPSQGNVIVLIGIASDRVRVGPVLTEQNNSCAGCLSLWIAHNRPDAGLWRQIAQLKGSPDLATYPWTPAAVQAFLTAIEAVIEAADPNAFRDIEVGSLAVTAHRHLPYPGCATCDDVQGDSPRFVKRPDGQAEKLASHVFRTQKLASVAALRDTYVDHRVGLVRHMYRDFTSKMLPMWGAETKLTASEQAEIGFGRAESGHTAEAVAILESLERFCGLLPRNRTSSVRGSYAGLLAEEQPVVDPEDFLLSEPSQHSEPGYDLPSYGPDAACDWLWAYSFKQDRPVLVPQQFCFYSGGLTPRDERYVIETSNGCALGGAYEEAIFHGLLELIERDAYMTRWHVKGAPQRIALDDPAMPQVARLHARATAEGFELHAFAIGIEIEVPTVLAMIVDPRDGASVASYCASGTNPNAESAIMGALVEVCSSIGVYQRQFGKERERATELLNDGSQAQDMRDHVLLYSHPEAVQRLDFLDRLMPAVTASSLFTEQEKRWQSGNLTAELHALVTEVCKVASDVLVIDQTSSILAPHDLHCVKVLAPGLHPITFGHQLRRISEERLESARQRLAPTEGRVSLTRNPHPHNFP